MALTSGAMSGSPSSTPPSPPDDGAPTPATPTMASQTNTDSTSSFNIPSSPSPEAEDTVIVPLAEVSAPAAAAEEEEPRSFVFETRVEKANEYRNSGSVKFRQGDYESALKDFNKGLYHVDFDELSYEFELLDEHRAKVVAVKAPLLVNVATCEFRKGNYDASLTSCDAAIKLDPENVKAHFRRAQIRVQRNDPVRALVDLETARKLDPENRDVLLFANKVKDIVLKGEKASNDVWRGKLQGKLGLDNGASKEVEEAEEEEEEVEPESAWWCIRAWRECRRRLFASKEREE